MIYLPKRRVDTALGRQLVHDDRFLVDEAAAVYGVPAYGVVTYGTLPLTDRAIVDIRIVKDFSHPHYEVYLA